MKHLTPIVFLAVAGMVTALFAAPSDQPTLKLSNAQMAARADEIKSELVDEYRLVLGLQDKAKKQKDVIKLNCVNDKLVQVKAQMNLADGQRATLDSALGGDAGNKDELFGELTSTRAEVQRLREDATACLGEPELFRQEAGVEVEKPVIPDDPTVIDPVAGAIVEVEPPGYASPFN